MYPPLDLRHVHCFVAAATTGTMTAAAERLHLSQSAVSLGVSALERRLDVQLLVRRRARTLLLTPAGRRFLPAARDLLAQADGLQRRAAAPGGGIGGPLTVGCFTTLAPVLLPGLLQGFTAEHPEVALDFVEGPVPELEAALRAGACDVAILDAHAPSADIEHEPLLRPRPYALFAASDPLAARESVTLAELVDRELILLSLPPSDDYLLRLFTSRGLEPRVRHRTTSHELVRGLVGRGLGYALLLTRPAHDLTHEGLRVAAVPIADAVEPGSFALARVRGGRLSRQAAAFARHCRERATVAATAPAAAAATPAPASARRRRRSAGASGRTS
jgi:DNA-binding transcriptional LysR family regulator